MAPEGNRPVRGSGVNPGGFLRKVLTQKSREIEAASKMLSLDALRARLATAPPPRDFARALRAAFRPANSLAVGSNGPSGFPRPAIIAEYKRASPSRGVIRTDLGAAEVAQMAEAAGAAALSVLTDREFFQGDPQFLREARAACGLPILRKDFIIDPYQVYEARYLGADAVLLIAAAVTPERLAMLVRLTNALGMTPLVEVHNAMELAAALAAKAAVVGINNRNLDTLAVDLAVTESLAPICPGDVLVVSESGIRTRADVERVTRAGAKAILVGEAVMSGGVGAAIRELLGDAAPGHTEGEPV